jgi:hypothetical protein
MSCDNCKKKCPMCTQSRKAYFSTTQYDGVLCSTTCALSWIIKCKRKKMKARKINIDDGNIKMININILN